MSNVVRHVRDITASDRQALEHMLGVRLDENEVDILGVKKSDQPTANDHVTTQGASAATLPDWCNVYEGMTDEEIADVDQAIFRAPGSRSFD